MKLVIYTNHGPSYLSEKAANMLIEKLGKDSIKIDEHFKKIVYIPLVDRFDKNLIEVLETLGEEAFGLYSSFKVIEVNEPFKIQEYDGSEYIVTLSEFQKDLIYPSNTN